MPSTPVGPNGHPMTEDRFLVALGAYPGVTGSNHFGHNPAVGTTFEIVREIGTTHVLDTSATALEISSSSTDDDGSPAGTGAQTILIEGLDANFAAISETVTLNGTTPVVSSLAFLRVNDCAVTAAGTGLVNAGDIYVADDSGSHTAGVPDDLTLVESQIPAGHSLSQTTMFTVPDGQFLYVANVLVFSTSGKSVTFQGHIFNPNTSIESVLFEGVVQDEPFSIERGSFVRLPEHFSVWIEAKVDTGSAEVSGAIDGWLVDNQLTL